jgi:hypothetical protein
MATFFSLVDVVNVFGDKLPIWCTQKKTYIIKNLSKKNTKR